MATARIQHSSRFIQHNALRCHRDHTRNGNTLLLSAGQKVRRMERVLAHAHLCQSLIHTVADFRSRNTEIFRTKCHILFHNICYDLVVRILENHTHIAADGNQLIFIGSIHAADPDFSATGQQNRIKMLCKCGLTTAIAAENRNQTSFFDSQVHILKHNRAGCVINARISKAKVLRFDNFTHTATSTYGVQRPVEPQGSIRPESRTGRPSSPTVVCPPWCAPNTTSDA